VKRFLKIFALLVVGLFLLASGIDVALDHLTGSISQSSFTVYNEQGKVVLAYNGDLSTFKLAGKSEPGPVVVPRFLHRT
jgi:hypothetical protein